MNMSDSLYSQHFKKGKGNVGSGSSAGAHPRFDDVEHLEAVTPPTHDSYSESWIEFESTRMGIIKPTPCL